MGDMVKKHGVFSFNELITTDLDSAKKFYGELLGWTFRDTKSIHGQIYVTALKDGAVVAGMMLKEGNVDDEAMPCWDPYITVDEVEESVKIVEKMGGRTEPLATSTRFIRDEKRAFTPAQCEHKLRPKAAVRP